MSALRVSFLSSHSERNEQRENGGEKPIEMKKVWFAKKWYSRRGDKCFHER